MAGHRDRDVIEREGVRKPKRSDDTDFERGAGRQPLPNRYLRTDEEIESRKLMAGPRQDRRDPLDVIEPTAARPFAAEVVRRCRGVTIQIQAEGAHAAVTAPSQPGVRP